MTRNIGSIAAFALFALTVLSIMAACIIVHAQQIAH